MRGFIPLWTDVTGKGLPLHWPTRKDIEAGSVTLLPSIRDSLISLVEDNAVSLLEGAQAHRKTVTAQLFSYQLSEAGWTISWGVADRLDYSEAVSSIHELDTENRLIVIDDCHRALEVVNALARSLERLKLAKVLLVSRPLPENMLWGRNTVIGTLKRRSAFLTLTADHDTFREVILGHLRDLHHYDAAQVFSDKVGFDGLKYLAKVSGGDFEVLDLLLQVWNSHMEDVQDIDLPQVLSAITATRFDRSQSRQILLMIAALYQYEIPVAINHLGHGIQRLIEEGVVQVVLDEKFRAFCTLSHPSLARLYLQAAEHAGWISIDSFVKKSVGRYLSSKPSNCYAVFRALHFAGEASLLRGSIEEKGALDGVVSVILAPEKDLFRALGTLAFVSNVNPAHASDIGRRYLQGWRFDDLETYIRESSPGAMLYLSRFLKQLGLGELILRVFVDSGGLRERVKSISVQGGVMLVVFLSFLRTKELNAVFDSMPLEWLAPLFQASLGEPRLAVKVLYWAQRNVSPSLVKSMVEEADFSEAIAGSSYPAEHFLVLSRLVRRIASDESYQRLLCAIDLDEQALENAMRDGSKFVRALEVFQAKDPEATKSLLEKWMNHYLLLGFACIVRPSYLARLVMVIWKGGYRDYACFLVSTVALAEGVQTACTALRYLQGEKTGASVAVARGIAVLRYLQAGRTLHTLPFCTYVSPHFSPKMKKGPSFLV